MKKIYSLSVLLTTFGLIITFVIVPILVKLFHYEAIIFETTVTYDMLLYNFFCVVFFIVFASIFKFKLSSQNNYQKSTNTNYDIYFFSTLFVIFWLLLYLVFGGLKYRDNDIVNGYQSRGSVLSFILSLYNVVIVIVIAIISRLKSKTGFRKFLGYLAVLLFVFIVILSGSRGILIQLFLSTSFLFLIKKENETDTKKNCALCFKLLNFKNFVIFSIVTFLFGLVGYLRDSQLEFGLQLLYRLAEPYWSMTLDSSEKFGGNFNVIYDAIDRMSNVVLKHFGHSIEGSIEGSDYYLDTYAGITFTEGISLPVTIFGFGFIIDPFYGVPFILTLTIILMRLSFNFNIFLSKQILWKDEFIITFATSCLLIYSKSFSGVFLILVYEKFTTFIILFFFSKLCLALKKPNY